MAKKKRKIKPVQPQGGKSSGSIWFDRFTKLPLDVREIMYSGLARDMPTVRIARAIQAAGHFKKLKLDSVRKALVTFAKNHVTEEQLEQYRKDPHDPRHMPGLEEQKLDDTPLKYLHELESLLMVQKRRLRVLQGMEVDTGGLFTVYSGIVDSMNRLVKTIVDVQKSYGILPNLAVSDFEDLEKGLQYVSARKAEKQLAEGNVLLLNALKVQAGIESAQSLHGAANDG